MSGRWERLYNGETTVNFFGRRRLGFAVSALALVVTVVSLFAQGLNLGIDFEGGVAWEAPRTGQISPDTAREVLEVNKIDANSAKIQILGGGDGERIRIQADNQDEDTILAVTNDLAELAGVEPNEVSVSSVSSSWGRSITEKAIRALVVFFILVSLFIAWRFEWKMAIAALAAVTHDVAISVGVYSVFGFEVTPATVIAFMTILGYSLYDTIVVFDKVKDNTDRFQGSRVSYGDIVNVSMNQVLMRSLNTSVSSLLPVVALLVLGSGVFGAVALRAFAVALLVGMITGVYSSIFIATPLLALMKQREPKYRTLTEQLSVGADMAHLATVGAPVSKRQVRAANTDSAASEAGANAGTEGAVVESVAAVLTHPPRPRKKRRR
jgi:preprotein translocase subunit SecF